MPTSGLPVLSQTVAMAARAPAQPASVVVTAMPPIARVGRQLGARVEAVPADQEDEAAEDGEGDVVPEDRPGLAVGPVLADAGAEELGAPERRATPPTMCTMLEPAKSWYGVGSACPGTASRRPTASARRPGR